MTETVGKLEILDPTLGSTRGKGTVSPRLDSVAGKTFGVIWNGRPLGDQIINRALDILKERHHLKEVVFRAKPLIGNAAPGEILEELSATCDAVVTGVGD